MASLKKRLIALAALTMSATLGGCMGDYGYGGVGYASDYYGPGYDGYGYGPDYAYGGYGAGLGGWYNDFYYPGRGVYVFDRSGRRSRWNDTQRRHWHEGRYQARPGVGRPDRPGIGRPGVGRPDRPSVGDGRPNRRDWRGPRQGYTPQPGQAESRPGAGVNRPQGPRSSAGQWRGREPGAAPATTPGAGRGSWGGGGRNWGGPRGGGAGRGSGRPRN